MDFEEFNSIPLQEVIDHFKLEIICQPENLSERVITSRDVTRPGLPLAGFYEHMDTSRIGIIGNAEYQYLSSKDSAARYESLSTYFAYHPAAIIFTSNNEIFDEVIQAAKEYDIPVLRTGERTSPLSTSIVSWLNVKLAPRITRHGVLVEVYGEGILILGDSGVGKSETAI